MSIPLPHSGIGGDLYNLQIKRGAKDTPAPGAQKPNPQLLKINAPVCIILAKTYKSPGGGSRARGRACMGIDR